MPGTPAAPATHLNPEQQRAASALSGPVLVLAGAGSGKTRVITARLANLLRAGARPAGVVALTFTNKAATEMRQRAGLGGADSPTISTFHSFGLTLLRSHGERLGLRRRPTVFDQADAQQVVKELSAELRLDADLSADTGRLQRMLSAFRMGRLHGEVEDQTAGQLGRLASAYRKRLRLYGAVDFDDLILLPLELLQGEHGDALRDDFEYVLVDEFQDTSERQYEVLHALGSEHRNVCVVGDDDQSIYSWRGANPGNFERFEQDFPELLQVKLEQNYRSTGTILDAANAVIALNRSRRSKRLWSAAGEGHLIQVCHAEDETGEAEQIARRIRELQLRDGIRYGDCAVLLRTNSLTRPLEEVFLRERIPYRVSGGISFFSRKEVRDLIGYLRLLANRDDDVAAMRVINTPRRGLGAAAVELLGNAAASSGCSLFSAAALIAAGEHPLPDTSAARLREPLAEWVALIEDYAERLPRAPKMAPVFAELVEQIGYRHHLLETERQEAAKWKMLNVDAVIDSVADYEDHPDTLDPSLHKYLARTALLSRHEDESDDAGPSASRAQRLGRVQVMTIHAAKGLEFPAVFLAGVDDGVLPHQKALAESPDNEQEERRLFYVAITRARRRLFLSTPAQRRVRGKQVECEPSPFLDELPHDLLDTEGGEDEVSAEQATELFADLRRRMADQEG